MLLKRAAPELSLPLAQVHAIGADVGLPVKFSPPDTLNIVILIQEYLPIHSAELFRGVHIKDKDSAGI